MVNSCIFHPIPLFSWKKHKTNIVHSWILLYDRLEKNHYIIGRETDHPSYCAGIFSGRWRAALWLKRIKSILTGFTSWWTPLLFMAPSASVIISVLRMILPDTFSDYFFRWFLTSGSCGSTRACFLFLFRSILFYMPSLIFINPSGIKISRPNIKIWSRQIPAVYYFYSSTSFLWR